MKRLILCVLLIVGIHINSYGIFIYKLNYKNIDLVIDKNFPKNGKLVCCANFTSDFNILKPIEERLVYSCTSNGIYYKRLEPKNIGVFTFYNKKFKFGYNKNELKKASKNNGMGFLQWMVIYNYQPKSIKTFNSPQHFRVLAEIKNELYFIEADPKLTMRDFIKELIKRNVKNAIYLDTGYGWETYYYVNSKNKKIFKHKVKHPFPFRTNFLVIK